MLQDHHKTFTERHLIKLVLYRFMEPLADTVGLRRHHFGFRVVDVIYRQMKPVIILLHFATVLCASVGQYSQHRQSMALIKRQYTIIQ